MPAVYIKGTFYVEDGCEADRLFDALLELGFDVRETEWDVDDCPEDEEEVE